ncbi:beta-carotene isomerase D27, chloroplastic-like [Gossypium australe]|uniref:Beta-carotene isomerase D27, chloroplastic-like n=1 Tax=Gossypium australe TaxID=47621 RepID=A0A5B6UR78_9ROSI|nr:beta-carotene isomerase D27, chloroplastic-like [Gossypium australe]
MRICIYIAFLQYASHAHFVVICLNLPPPFIQISLMEAKVVLQSRTPTGTSSRGVNKQRCSPVRAVLARPAESIVGSGTKERLRLKLKPADSKREVAQDSSSVHNDNWFDLWAINYLSQSLQAATGVKSMLSGYESLVETTAMMSKKFNTKTQQELVIQVLDTAIPKLILNMASFIHFFLSC